MINRVLELYVRRGVSLTSMGLNEAALPLDDAIEALTLFQWLEWTILGGDIYRDINGALELAYMDWFCSDETNAQKSIEEAREILLSKRDKSLLIAFTLRCKSIKLPNQPRKPA